MATILNFEAYQHIDAPSHWVDAEAPRARVPLARGWWRDVACITETLFADDIGPPERERVQWACARTREFAEAVGGKAAFAFRASVFATTWIAPVLIMKAPPLRRLQHVDRVRALERYERSMFGLSVFALKAFIGINWFEHPDSAREVNFDGKCKGRK